RIRHRAARLHDRNGCRLPVHARPSPQAPALAGRHAAHAALGPFGPHLYTRLALVDCRGVNRSLLDNCADLFRNLSRVAPGAYLAYWHLGPEAIWSLENLAAGCALGRCRD